MVNTASFAKQDSGLNTLSSENITPHQVINLLLDGALERVDVTISRIQNGDLDEALLLVQKTIGIVGGLRESLDLKAGGDIAENLDMLYEYIAYRLDAINLNDSPIPVLNEVRKLLAEIHAGWEGISGNSIEHS